MRTYTWAESRVDSERANVSPVCRGLGFISNEKGNNWKAILVLILTVRRSEQQVFGICTHFYAFEIQAVCALMEVYVFSAWLQVKTKLQRNDRGDLLNLLLHGSEWHLVAVCNCTNSYFFFAKREQACMFLPDSVTTLWKLSNTFILQHEQNELASFQKKYLFASTQLFYRHFCFLFFDTLNFLNS